jgi:hypothetical protein
MMVTLGRRSIMAVGGVTLFLVFTWLSHRALTVRYIAVGTDADADLLRSSELRAMDDRLRTLEYSTRGQSHQAAKAGGAVSRGEDRDDVPSTTDYAEAEQRGRLLSAASSWQAKLEAHLALLGASRPPHVILRRQLVWAMEPFWDPHEPLTRGLTHKIDTCIRGVYEAVTRTETDERGAWAIFAETWLPSWLANALHDDQSPMEAGILYSEMRLGVATSRIVGLLHPPVVVPADSEGSLGPYNAEEAQRGIASLRRHGYYIMERRFPPAVVEAIKRATTKVPYRQGVKFDLQRADGVAHFVQVPTVLE